jgi:hypothetical protein
MILRLKERATDRARRRITNGLLEVVFILPPSGKIMDTLLKFKRFFLRVIARINCDFFNITKN